MKVLILGGYGVFGGRLVQLLHDIDGLHLIVSGRSLARAQALCARHGGKTRVEPLALDRANTREALRTHRLNLVVDASGPFQQYQANPYYAAAFTPRAITFGFRDDTTGTIYQHILGPAFDMLPPRLRELHGTSEPRQWTGSATVQRGTSPAARLLCALIGFPAPAKTAAVTVTFTPTPAGERWTRTIGGKTFKSLQSAGNGPNQYLLVEQFGAAKVSLALVQDGTRLLFIPRRWTLFGLPMPARLFPTGQSFETELDGNFAFDITIQTSLAGLVIAYRGTLQPATTTAPPAAMPQLEPTP